VPELRSSDIGGRERGSAHRGREGIEIWSHWRVDAIAKTASETEERIE
jgi:hypothetical protein